MGVFSSKRVYSVASSSFPIFDPDKRVKQYLYATLDYNSNSDIEKSEYMKQFYDTSRLRDLLGFRNWWEIKGFPNIFGRTRGYFYGDANLDYNVLTDIMDDFIYVPPNSTFKVYSANLNFFSEDFWIKHLATQQGKESLVLQDSTTNYTISYPNSSTIRATFSNGQVIEGAVPAHIRESRFIEISYSTLIEKTETKEVTNKDGSKSTIKETTYTYKYGFYHYLEGTGNARLDNIIRYNTITATYSFLPVIPIRVNTNWFYNTNQVSAISESIRRLRIIGNLKANEDPYQKLKDTLVKGMSGGSLGDIDYGTIILGVTLNSNHQSDLKYLYNFFLNIHVNANYAGIRTGVVEPKDSGSRFGSWASSSITRIREPGTGMYKAFSVNCPASNLNLTYKWGGSDYMEANGKFRPDAKVGQYGVLSGRYTHRWTTQEPKTDNEGNVISYYDEQSGRTIIQYETVRHRMDYEMVLFCHQVQENRWRFVVFIDLHMNNLIYAGKSDLNTAHGANMDAAATAQVTHNFNQDIAAAPGEYYQFTFNYITAKGDSTNGFIVPLEEKTLREVGIVDQLELSYGCQYIIFNCWESRKVKWYQRGFFSIALSFAGAVVFLSAGFMLIGLFFATTFTVLATAKMMALTLKIFQIIFGKSLGLALYNWSLKIFTTIVVTIVGKIPVFGWIIAAAIMFTITAAQVINAGGSLEDAFKQGLIAGAISAVASYAGAAVNSAVAGSASTATSGSLVSQGTTFFSAQTAGAVSGAFVSGSISGFGQALASGKSFSDSLKIGLQSGAIAGLSVGAGIALKGIFASDISIFKGDASKIDTTKISIELNNNVDTVNLAPEQSSTVSEMINLTGYGKDLGIRSNFMDVFQGKVIKNPNTYVDLLKATQEARSYHKLANLENDYQEFTDNYRSALKVLEVVNAQNTSTVTAEFVCKLQNCTGRLISLFPETSIGMTVDDFITMSISSGSDMVNSVTQNVSTFVENKLLMDGYYPDTLFYTQDYFTTFS